MQKDKYICIMYDPQTSALFTGNKYLIMNKFIKFLILHTIQKVFL